MEKEVKNKKIALFQNFLLAKSIFFVLILVIGTNWLSKRHLSTVQSTIDSVYEDQRIAQHYMYKLNHEFNLKRLGLSTNSSFSNTFKENTTIEQLLTDFEAIKLTAKESSHLSDLKTKYLKLLDLEKSIMGSTDETLEKTYSRMNIILDRIMVIMNDLANIRFTESSKLSEKEKKSLSMDKLLLKVEISSLIVIGIIVQLIIFYPDRGKRSLLNT